MSCTTEDFSYFCPRLQRKVFFDYYALLNIEKCASEEQIRKAYRILAKLYHPDRCIQDKKEISKEKFKILGDAYQNLIDPERRIIYNTILKQIEIKQNAKKLNPQGICSVLQSCSREELVYVLLGSFCTPQNYDCPQQQQQQQSSSSDLDATEKQKECSQNIPKNNFKQSNNNGFFSSKNNKNSHKSFSFPQLNQMNTNNFECNAQTAVFSDDENISEESEGEPQCQGSDAISFSSNQSEQNFYQKFSFFNNINTKETLNPQNFTFLKGIFNNNCIKSSNIDNENCSDEFSLRFKQFQEENQCKSTAQDVQKQQQQQQQQQQISEIYASAFNQSKDNNNCKIYQSNSTILPSQLNPQNDHIQAEDQNCYDISNDVNKYYPNQINQEDNEEQEEDKTIICKNRLTKADIKMVQRQKTNQKIIERIRNKKQVFTAIISKRIKKQD